MGNIKLKNAIFIVKKESASTNDGHFDNTLASNKYHIRKKNFRNFDIYVNHSNDSNEFNQIKFLGFKIVKNLVFLGQNF